MIGPYIPAVINVVSRFISPLPLYLLPANAPEGAFWRVLSVSMMAMITWIAVQAYRDPRGHANLVPVLLLSKACSTACYTVFFIMYGHLAYIVGFVTDGPIFLVTAGLWYAAAGGDRYLTPGEQRILAVIGKAFMPRVSGACRMLSALDMPTLVGLRLSLHMLNWTSLPSFGRRLTTLTQDQQVLVLTRLEVKRSVLLRGLVITAKVLTLVPFFEQPEAARAVGYDPEARIRP
ncbi:MAG: hypothetical protein NTU83_07765 [Candidatus Hydrogenedentes bacterium]|nr:hypothetical protein [Candidatus Hydrogenedentota bacterium]